MSTTSRSHSRKASRKAPFHPGKLSYSGTPGTMELGSATNEEHTKILLGELPYMRLALVLLGKSDKEVEGMFDCQGMEGLELGMSTAEALAGISQRLKAGSELAESGAARLVIVLDRLHKRVTSRTDGKRRP